MKREMDMLNGSLWDKILLFALPMALSGMLQQLFTAADAAVVGRFAGKAALAAVGSNTALVNLIINMFIGLTVGTSVLVARHVGSGERDKISKAVHTSITVAAVSGVLLVFIGCAASRFMLEWMATPSDVIDLATIYLRIYFCCMPFAMVYNFGVAILRSVGDTKRPLVILVIAGVVNVIFNLIFVIVFHMHVIGVGVATVISNILSAILVIYYLLKETGDIKLEPQKLSIDKPSLAGIMRIGIPAGLQNMVFSLSNVVIQTSINGFGSTVVSAGAAVVNFEFLAWFIISAFVSAATTFVSQNYGAQKLDRCKRAVRISLGWCIIFTIVFDVTCFILRYPLIGIFSTDAGVIEVGIVRMKYILMLNAIACIYEVLSGGMRGLGYSLSPAIFTVLGVCVLRLAWVYTVFPTTQTFESLLAVYPLSWIATNIMIVTAYFVVMKKVRRRQI